MHRLFLALIFCLVLWPGLMALSGCAAVPQDNRPASAAIIDQLNPSIPNSDFITRTTALLENTGFKVDYFSGDRVNLDLYRRLPSAGYGLIIFRAHSGLLGNGAKTDQKTCLFTNQPYSRTADLGDQLLDRVVKAAVDECPPLFGIGAAFVGGSMHGRFNRTLIIMMGCSSLEKDDLARAFLDKGALAYCGWNAEVKLSFDEDVTLKLLDVLAQQNSLETAVRTVMQDRGPDPQTGAELKYRVVN
jgi:hypothetical protein